MLTVVPDPGDANPTDSGSLLDEIVRDAALQMRDRAMATLHLNFSAVGPMGTGQEESRGSYQRRLAGIPLYRAPVLVARTASSSRRRCVGIRRR